MRRVVPLVGLVLLVACGPPQATLKRTFMGKPVIDAPFVIAGGKTIYLPSTDGGPIPAENDLVIIQSAGFFVAPSKGNPKQPVLHWGFSFKSKGPDAFEEVIVGEVSPSEKEVIYLKDSAPVLKNKQWLGNRDPLIVSQTSTPWLYSGKASIFVFKFTIKAKGQAPTVLYQPAWFSKEVKSMFVSSANRMQSIK